MPQGMPPAGMRCRPTTTPSSRSIAATRTAHAGNFGQVAWPRWQRRCGWLAGGPHRELAPAVPPASGEVALIGIAAPPPAAGPLAQQSIDASLGPGLLRVQRLDSVELSRRLDLDLEPWTLRTDPAPPQLTPGRHRAYALQWFLLAAVLAGLYVGLNLRRH